MQIILLGPPGAGKGTQAGVLAKEIDLVHISTGDLLRQNVAGGSELGREAKDFMLKGLLVPDTLVTKMLSDRFDQPDTQKGFILDGYPRNLAQAKALDELLKSKNKTIDIVFYLETSESVIIQRLTGRLVCSKCGLNFHIKNMPPKIEMICDNCGGGLYQRPDDKEETIRKRLEVYVKEASELIEYYTAKKKLHRVVADGEAEVVLKEMVRLVAEYDDTFKA